MSLELDWTFIISVSLGIFIMAAALDYKLSRRKFPPANVEKVKLVIAAVDNGQHVSYCTYLYGSLSGKPYRQQINRPDPYNEIQRAYSTGVFVLKEHSIAIPASRIDSIYVGKPEEHWL